MKTNQLAESEVIINATVQEVFKYVSNMENFKLWFPEVMDIQSSNDLQHGEVGKTYTEIVNIPPDGEQKLTIMVKAAESPNLYVTESEFDPLFPRMTISLSDKEKSMTQVKWKMESRSQDENFINDTLPDFQKIMGERAVKGLAILKQQFETN